MASAIDLCLKSLVHCEEFVTKPESKWNAIANLLPGTTPQNVQIF